MYSDSTENSAVASGESGVNKESGARRKSQEGIVTKVSMEKTVVVTITTLVKHRAYHKYIRRSKKYLAHDETKQCRVGDRVRLIETRPLSKRKRWRVDSILSTAAAV